MKKNIALFSIAILASVALLTTTSKVEAGFSTPMTCALPGSAYGMGYNSYYPCQGGGGPGPVYTGGWGGYNSYHYTTPTYGTWYNYRGYGGWNGYGFPYGQSYYNGLPYQAYYGNYIYGNYGRCYYTATGAYVCI